MTKDWDTSEENRMDRTLAILKPDTVSSGNVGKIIARIEEAGFVIIAMKKVRLTKQSAEKFYAVHREKHFYTELVEFMSSGACVPLVLEKQNAVNDFRDLIGPTNPDNATPGTIRADFATNTTRNAVHGSDSPENAVIETLFFFSTDEILCSI